MRTDNPEQDAQTFIESQEDEQLDNCVNCGELVPWEEIDPKTDYLGASCGCQGIDFCICGVPRDACEHCKTIN